jgi:hypothetical protein
MTSAMTTANGVGEPATAGRDAPSGRARISCFIVCQDEEAGIAECLESVRWCDEIVVVDGGSIDRTLEICGRYTERVFRNPWPGYVRQKQFAFAQTVHPWVLNVDADEQVSEQLRDEILEILAHVPPDIDGYYMRRLVYYLGRWWHRGPWYPGWRLRLVRRARASWGGTDPHDLATVEGRTRRLTRPLLHFTYGDIADHLASMNRLTDIAAASRGKRGSRASLFLRPAWRFAWTYTAAGGFREGLPGLFVCMTAAFYVFLRLAKGFERRIRGAETIAAGGRSRRGVSQ